MCAAEPVTALVAVAAAPKSVSKTALTARCSCVHSANSSVRARLYHSAYKDVLTAAATAAAASAAAASLSPAPLIQTVVDDDVLDLHPDVCSECHQHGSLV
eukprot:7839-Heterococcus_DN1.PRE.2